jgi:hypothetical protein
MEMGVTVNSLDRYNPRPAGLILAEVKSPPRAPKALPIAPALAVPETAIFEYLSASIKSCAPEYRVTKIAMPDKRIYFFMA